MDNLTITPEKLTELRHVLHGAVISLRDALNGEEDPTTAMETAKALTTRALEIVEIP